MITTLLTIKFVVFFGFLGLMACCESIRPKRGWNVSRWKRWFFHSSLALLNTVLTRLIIVAPLFAWIAYVRERGWGLAGRMNWEGWSHILITLIVYDCLNYWWHRANHQVPFLWRFHRAHHTDTAVDVTTSLRFHPGELFISYGVKAVFILAWGPTIEAFIFFETAITLYSQFHHTNIDFPDPVEKAVSRIHITPRLHASHHTVAIRSRDGNFSTIFILWDYLFGTFRRPDETEMKTLGLTEDRDRDLAAAVFLKTPFRSLT